MFARGPTARFRSWPDRLALRPPSAADPSVKPALRRAAPASRALGLMLALLCAAPSAQAQLPPGMTDSQSCRQQCGALLPRRQDNTGDVQICLARCETRERVQPPRSAAIPTPPRPARVSRAEAAAPRPPARAAQPPAVPRTAPALPASLPPGLPAPALPASSSVAHGAVTRGAMPPRTVPSAPRAGSQATEADLPSAASNPRHGVIHLAPPPSLNYGLTAGLPDRAAAHRLAEQQCMGPQGAACRLALEFQDRCGAVAHGLIPRGLFLTNSPTTFNVMLATPGTGATQALAEQDAMAACRQRFRGTCRVAGSLCGPPG